MADLTFILAFPDIWNTDLTVVSSSLNILKIIYTLSRKSIPLVKTCYPNYNALLHFSHCTFSTQDMLSWLTHLPTAVKTSFTSCCGTLLQQPAWLPSPHENELLGKGSISSPCMFTRGILLYTALSYVSWHVTLCNWGGYWQHLIMHRPACAVLSAELHYHAASLARREKVTDFFLVKPWSLRELQSGNCMADRTCTIWM